MKESNFARFKSISVSMPHFPALTPAVTDRQIAAPVNEICCLIRMMESLRQGEEAVELLVGLGPAAIEPLQQFWLAGKPNKIFQPRLRAVEALARLEAKEVLTAYLFQERKIPDPQERFGEEAVESAAARFLANWPDAADSGDIAKAWRRGHAAGPLITKTYHAAAAPD